MYMYMYIYIYIYIHIHTHIYIYIYTHIYIDSEKLSNLLEHGKVPILYAEYVERTTKYEILFVISLFCEYTNLEYARVHSICRVHQAKHAIPIPMAAPQECVNTYSTRKASRQGIALSLSLYTYIHIHTYVYTCVLEHRRIFGKNNLPPSLHTYIYIYAYVCIHRRFIRKGDTSTLAQGTDPRVALRAYRELP